MTTQTDITVIGGGIVGLSVALGLLDAGQRVTVLDGADGDLRASQGNFGLVWLQGKGARYPAYAHWTSKAVAAWPEFAATLSDISGMDVKLEQPGGYEFFTDETEFAEFSGDLALQKEALVDDLPCETLSGEAVRRRIPSLGPAVVGATYCARDGHVNPLLLLRALGRAVRRRGGLVEQSVHVDQISPTPGGGFALRDRQGQLRHTGRLVLCAGLGAMTLAPQLGFRTKVRPQRGELLITEKLGSHLPFLSSTIRQVNEGGIQIGGTKAEVGLDDNDTLGKTAGLARHAVDVLPALASVSVLRSWGALRIMTGDGYPVYARSPDHPDACLVTCHSGVTLAPNHAGALAKWIEGASDAPELDPFDEHRFKISEAA
ncbi:NAD(P)/FAD-dependent oxidoreductase [Primorskyibacter sp. S87]|uniref:NAD(P)/FAD-dependent oxidoreductase n=1 Tax=Primorskyibacter sp. S87 TaxID=3415126 RepID=UPI003C7B5DE7